MTLPLGAHYPTKTIIGSVEIQTTSVSGHGIREVIFIAVDMTAEQPNSISYNKLIETAAQIGMHALSVDDRDYYMEMTKPAIWFAGDPETITLFSLKYRKHIKASLDQETMNAAIKALKGTLLHYPGYFINYIDGLFRLVTDCRIILRPDYKALWKIKESGKQRPMPRNIRIDTKTWKRA